MPTPAAAPETSASVKAKARNNIFVADVGSYINSNGRRVPYRPRWSLTGPHAVPPSLIAYEVNRLRESWRAWSRTYRRDKLGDEYVQRLPRINWTRPVWIGPGAGKVRPDQPDLPRGAVDPTDEGAVADAVRRRAEEEPGLLAGHLANSYFDFTLLVEEWARETRKAMKSAHEQAGGMSEMDVAGRAATVTFGRSFLKMMKASFLPTMDRLSTEIPMMRPETRDVAERWEQLNGGKAPNVPNVIDRYMVDSGRVKPGIRVVRERITLGEAIGRRLEAMAKRAEGGRGRGAADKREARGRLLAAFGFRVGADPREPSSEHRRPEADDLQRLGVGLDRPVEVLAEPDALTRFLTYWFTDTPSAITFPDGQPMKHVRPGKHNSRKNRLDAVFGLLLWLRDRAGIGFTLPVDVDLSDYRLGRVDKVPDPYDPERMQATFDLARGTVWWPRILLMTNCSFGPLDVVSLNNADIGTDDNGHPAIFREGGRPRIEHKAKCPTLHTLFPELADALKHGAPGRGRSTRADAPVLVGPHGIRLERRGFSKEWKDRAVRRGLWGKVYMLAQLRAVAASHVEKTHGDGVYRMMLCRPIPKADRPYIRQHITHRLTPAIMAWRDRLVADGVL